MFHFGTNLRRLMAREGLTLEEVVQRSGLDQRTVKSILSQTSTPRARTLHRLAAGLGCSPDEFFQDPASLAHRLFDRETNPHIEQAIAEHPDWFANWTEPDFDELYSRFGTGGALAAESISQVVETMNRNRIVHRRVALILESGEAEFLVELVQLLYHRIAVESDNGTPG
ncbi:MAG: XRE family transcriptional regulator [Planctomycetota bacterium]|nr:MAG: XRE family transcriptional regulator [Planctomycetota bacterium]REJ89981.1 MAG: XRE family transcriptional regulator [Planctomycetota bacterium]REK28214.1 MAG: XRE family transcriptional regulator [Planctomycetota bacterium]REK39791.1 MAG: XRE family transcriptional regulator [Planctomycetota bacterium]